MLFRVSLSAPNPLSGHVVPLRPVIRRTDATRPTGDFELHSSWSGHSSHGQAPYLSQERVVGCLPRPYHTLSEDRKWGRTPFAGLKQKTAPCCRRGTSKPEIGGQCNKSPCTTSTNDPLAECRVFLSLTANEVFGKSRHLPQDHEVPTCKQARTPTFYFRFTRARYLTSGSR